MNTKKELVVFRIKKSRKQKSFLELVSREDIKWWNVLLRWISENKKTIHLLDEDSILKQIKRFDVVVISINEKTNAVSVSKKNHSLSDEESTVQEKPKEVPQEIKEVPKEQIKMVIPNFVSESPYVDEHGNDSGSSDNVNEDKKGGAV